MLLFLLRSLASVNSVSSAHASPCAVFRTGDGGTRQPENSLPPRLGPAESFISVAGAGSSAMSPQGWEDGPRVPHRKRWSCCRPEADAVPPHTRVGETQPKGTMQLWHVGMACHGPTTMTPAKPHHDDGKAELCLSHQTPNFISFLVGDRAKPSLGVGVSSAAPDK